MLGVNKDALLVSDVVVEDEFLHWSLVAEAQFSWSCMLVLMF